MGMEWLRRHSKSVLFLFALGVLGGLYSLFSLPVSLFPNIQFPRIAVVIDSGDRPVERMIVEVTQPVETAIRSIPGVLNIKSESSRGSMEISADFDWNINMEVALLQVQSAILQILPSLPVGTTFEAKRMMPVVFPIIALGLTSNTNDMVSLRDFAEYQLRPYLLSIPGISKIEILGGNRSEFHVLVDPLKIQGLGITMNDIVNALSANNIVTAVGRIEDFFRLYLILSDTRLDNMDEIKNTIVRKSENGIVDLSDIATIEEGVVPTWTRVTSNGKDAVVMNILQQPGANAVAIAESLKKGLSDFQSKVPKDVHISTWYDQSQLITESANSVRDAIIIGAIFSMIILFLFLSNFKMAFVIAFILPCVLIADVLCMNYLNMSFNIMTLGGMAAAVGLIIDDGAVLLEYITRRQSEIRKNNHEFSSASMTQIAGEMLKPFAGSSLATIIIFFPLVFIQGVMGGFFKALSLTLSISLILSFFFVFFIMPLLGDFFIRRIEREFTGLLDPTLERIKARYLKYMHKFLNNASGLFTAVVILVILGALSYFNLGSGFMPKMDEGGFILDYRTAPGTSLSETHRLLNEVEQLILKMPELDTYSRRTGSQLGGGLTEPNTGDFFIKLKSGLRQNVEDIMRNLRTEIQNKIPGISVETAQLMEDMIGDLTSVPEPIEIKIFGDDQTLLQQTAVNIAKSISSIPGVVEVKNGIIFSGDTVDINVDRIKAALLNLEPKSITEQLALQLNGKIASQIQNNEKIIGIRVWTPESIRNSIESLKNLILMTSDAHHITLNEVATLSIQQGQVDIIRENTKPMITVTARLEGRDLGSTMNAIQNKVKNISYPSKVYIQLGGLYKEQQKSFYQLLIVFISGILLILFLLLYLYNDMTIAFSIILTTLLSLAGIFIGLWITNTELNISTMMGIIMILGIVTEIAIFYFSELCESGNYEMHDSKNIIIAGINRMRPILMTAIITIVALLPLALGIGTGSAMQQPLAIAIISGLIFALPLVLLFMPVLYYKILNLYHAGSRGDTAG